MANIRRISFFMATLGGLLVVMLIASVMWRLFDRSLVEQLLRKKSRTAAFAELLKKNEIYGLPAEFSFTADGSSIDCFKAKDKTGARLVVAMVMYPVRVSGSGVRVCSFVFDASGHCVLWSKDSMRSDGGLVDFTGDGYLEKFVSFSVEDGSRWPPSDKFQVFIISSGEKELVLEIVYNIGKPDLTMKDHVSVWVIPNWPGQKSSITLSEGGVKRVELVWSVAKQSFIVKGPKSSSKWRIIVVVPTENSIRP